MSSTITPVAGLQPAIGINLGPSYLTAAIQTDQEATRELVKIEGMFPIAVHAFKICHVVYLFLLVLDMLHRLWKNP